MDWSLRKIKATQVEQGLTTLSKILRPKVGWIKTIRETLGMNTRQLGERCNVTSERIIKIEADEVDGRTTLATLEKVAKAMNCKLVYALVPNDELVKIIEKAAQAKAELQLRHISHTMSLEDQKVSEKALKEQVLILKEELIKGNIKKVWDK
ncbi:MAG: mobile mystery protein A [Holosporales bacterium]|jgi:predicted DNA-binding mobile mystery protein A